MNYKLNTLIILLGLVVLSALALAWPALPAQAGPELPPRDPTPTQPPPVHDDDDNDDGPLVGAYIELQVGAPAGVWAGVQWQNSAGGWYEVEGWQGWLVNSSRWWVHPKDFGTGPFRWVVKSGAGGAVLGVSEPFNLPTQPNQTVQQTVSLAK